MKKFTANELSQILKVSLGTFRNQYANNLERINERLEALGENFRIVERKKIGRSVFFIASDLSPEHAPGSASPPVFQEGAGSPPPAPSFSHAYTETDRKEIDSLSSEKRKEALKKLEVVKFAMSFGVRKAAERFGLSPSTVHRWCKTYTGEGVKGLVGIREKEVSEAERYVLNVAEALFCTYRKLTVKDIYKEVKKLANKSGVELSYDKLRKHIQEFYLKNRYYAERLRRGESKAQRFLPRAGRVNTRFQPNDRWEWDHTRMDNFVLYKGKLVRPWLSIIRDSATSYIVSYLLLPFNPNAGTVARLVIEAFKKYGMPKVIRTDWGKDFNAERIRKGLEELGIVVSNARPYSGWDKGTVEGGFKTIKTQFCRKLPCYTQEDPKERKDLERIWGKETPLTFEEYEKRFSEYVEGVNLEKAETYRPFERKGVDGEFLWWAFAERKRRTVTKATIRIDNEYYYADELEKYEGQKVEVRLDDENDTYVKVFTLDGKFICDAVAESKREPEAWREKVKRRKKKAKAFEKMIRTRLELYEIEKEREEEAEKKLHYREMESLLKELPQETVREEVIPEVPEAKEEEFFVPTDDYELLSYIIERRGDVPERIWELYERFKAENPLAETLYSSEIEEIERLKREVRK